MPSPWVARILRYLRSKVILSIILFLSAMYSLYSFSVKNNSETTVRPKTVLVKSFENDKFIWNTNTSESNMAMHVVSCKNSQQGKLLIADDLGHLCRRADVLPNGCCNTNVSSTKRYVCDSCLPNNCCEIYEHCLSCCMNPDKRPLIESVLKKLNSRFQFILLETKDQFELCSVRCRTNSRSVYHGNMYRHPTHKYCFGELPENDDAIS